MSGGGGEGAGGRGGAKAERAANERRREAGGGSRGCSSVVERMLRMYEVPGSIPGISTWLFVPP